MTQILDILGNCPMGCGPHLHRMQTGAVKCLARGCPEPLAVQYILNETETEHLVYLGEDSWQALHPLRERINGALLTCHIRYPVETMRSLELQGSYRVSWAGPGTGDWDWEPLRGDRGEGEQEEAGDAATQAAAEPEKRDEAEPNPPQPPEPDRETAAGFRPRGRGSPAFP